MGIRVAAPFVLTLVWCGLASSAEQSAKPTWTFKAEKIEQIAEKTVKATGSVEVVGSHYRLTADTVEIRTLSSSAEDPIELVAEGNVVLTKGTERLTLQHLVLKPNTRTVTFRLP
jgi:lipopolysaccharide assembly outer membrane protein LptD (OstA)